MPKKTKKKDKEIQRMRRTKHKASIKKVLISDLNKPNGIAENPFIVKSRVISKRVSSVIIGIQQPILQMLDLDSNTWYRQYCDPDSKIIYLEAITNGRP